MACDSGRDIWFWCDNIYHDEEKKMHLKTILLFWTFSRRKLKASETNQQKKKSEMQDH